MEYQTKFYSELKGKEPDHDFLEVMSGPEDGKRFEITRDDVSIGRLPENDFSIPLELTVSRRHAILSREGEEYEVKILPGVMNPGEVEDQPLSPGETARVPPGRVFSLGNVQVELRKAIICRSTESAKD